MSEAAACMKKLLLIEQCENDDDDGGIHSRQKTVKICVYIGRKTIFHQTEHKRLDDDDDDEEKRIVKLISRGGRRFVFP